MQRLHIHIGVEDLTQGEQFYSALFGAGPDKRETDYMQWKLDDPRVNFAISNRTEGQGIDHLGLQADTAEGLETIRLRLQEADAQLLDEGETTCCYAHSDKSWVVDPAGVAWEAFHTLADAPVYGVERQNSEACCVEQNEETQEPPTPQAMGRCC